MRGNGQGLQERLSQGEVLVVQGPTGTELELKGLPKTPAQAMADSAARATVEKAHAAYARAGASVLVAYTFGAQAERQSNRKRGVNRAAERGIRTACGIVRSVATSNHIVAGSVGPVGDCYEPVKGQYTDSELLAVQRDHVELLAGGGIDLIWAETVPSSPEAAAAAQAAYLRESPLPYVLSFYYRETDGGLRLPTGEPLGEAVEALVASEHPPLLVAANCVPFETAEEGVKVLRAAAPQGMPVGIYPNGAGVPDDSDPEVWRDLVQANLEPFAAAAPSWLAAGAVLVGGCCCTTPDYTEALRDIADTLGPTPHTSLQL